MEQPKNEPSKLSDMVMCGDHPSFTKTELNLKEGEAKTLDNKDKERTPTSYARISPTASRSSKPLEQRLRATSEHALRALEARRRVRSLDAVQRGEADGAAPGNKALVQAALGSFRWPPYLLVVWVLVLVLTHMLHCLVSVLEQALPRVKSFCQYFRNWTEDTWKTNSNLNHRIYPLFLAFATGLLYTVYFGLYLVYSIALWSIEPLCSEDEKHSSNESVEPRITNYVDDVNSKTNSSVKQ